MPSQIKIRRKCKIGERERSFFSVCIFRTFLPINQLTPQPNQKKVPSSSFFCDRATTQPRGDYSETVFTPFPSWSGKGKGPTFGQLAEARNEKRKSDLSFLFGRSKALKVLLRERKYKRLKVFRGNIAKKGSFGYFPLMFTRVK